MDATRSRTAWPEPALHDRRVPGAGGTIDHLAVSANGVWVVAEQHVRGQVRLKTNRDLLGRIHLSVNGCDRTPWASALEEQVRHVRRTMAEAELLHVAVHGALCFVDTELSFMQRQLPLDDGVVTWPRALQKQLHAPGPIDDRLRAQVRAVLERAFPDPG